MGVSDRDYYRQDPPAGGILGGVAPVCKWLIAINVVVFVLQTLTQDSPSNVSRWLKLSPNHVVYGLEVWRLITYAFCHGDLMHIAGNMFFLWICGSQVEPIYGQREFLRFYLTAAFLSGIGFLAFELKFGHGASSLGASGAVMAVAMLCALYYPSMKILFMFVIPIEMRWLVALYVVFDTYQTLQQLGTGFSMDHVAHSAHLAGLLYGFLYKKYDLRYSRLLAGWSWPKFKRLARTAMRRKPEHVRLYEPPQETVPTADLGRQVDEILAKISAQGESSLTESEREILKEASRRYKKR
ncbi:MAG: rhomboid family intramembrane serine protease [Planctomycetia bacterium]|nr:rhomboid family intramembrane serine protease [Planctomycetia bacterium]